MNLEKADVSFIVTDETDIVKNELAHEIMVLITYGTSEGSHEVR